MAASVTFDVLDETLVAELRRVEGRLDDLMRYVADELEEALRDEGGKYSRRLAEPWEIDGTGPFERKVTAPEFFAHFIAHGTQAHEAKRSDRMFFSVDGEWVAASHVSGGPATNFDEAAIERARGRVDDIMRRLIEGAV